MESNDPMGIYDKKCPMCGKEFSINMTCGWAYTKGYTKFCSWKCLRAYEKSQQKTNEKKEQVKEMLHKGMTQYQIAQKLYMSFRSVNYWVNKIKDEEMQL